MPKLTEITSDALNAIRATKRSGHQLSLDEALARACSGADTTPAELKGAVGSIVIAILYARTGVQRNELAAGRVASLSSLLGEWLLYGRFAPKDVVTGKVWVTLAAEMGVTRAQVSLGHLLMEGLLEEGIRGHVVARRVWRVECLPR